MKSVKTINFDSGGSPAVHASGTAVAFAALILGGVACGADVTLGTADAFGTSSLEVAGGWSNVAAPSAANDYIVSITRLRTPADTLSHTFAGNSLKITTTNGNLTFKGSGSPVITINNLILDGGLIDHLMSSADVFNLAGNLAITGTGSRIAASQGAINVAAAVSGTGDLAIINNLITTFSGLNTYTGTITLGGAFVLAPTGSLTFKIGATGVNNQVTGTGAGTFNGTFNIDLSTAGNTVGNNWTLVNVATVVETFGESFNIPGFSENENVWTSADGKYQFLEATGVLSRINGDTDGDGLPDAWEMQYFHSLDETATSDPDDDFSTNLMEYQAGTNPTNAASYPDTDSDLLGDGWEIRYFGNLTETGAGDPDGDYNSNAVEFAARTDPTSKYNYPDTDEDGINDGWEIRYFGSIVACDPVADPDGDLYSNYDEFSAFPGFDPIVQISSPDTDMDGLPDGWEVKYFRIGSEDLESVIVRYGAVDDVDSDGFTNLMEYKANTNPLLATSFPAALAYWRFEERTTGVVPVGDNTGGNQKDTVLDSTGLGNHMMTWRDYTSPLYSNVVPFATVPLTSAANTASMNFVRDGSNLYITDNVYTSSGVELNSHVFTAFTIEASFNTNATNVWQVVIGKTGNPIGGQAPFSLKIRATDNKLIAGIVDGAGAAKEAVSTRAITTNTWFSTVVTASATELKLWIKGSTDANYVLEATTAINGAFYTYAGVDAPWVIGLGKWNGADADPFGGYIDEVRISGKVLAPAEFLIPVVSNDTDNDGMDDTWETTYFGGLGQTAIGDFDGDGTSNLTEYRLGLTPNSGTSRFTVTRAANGNLTWPSATGVKFDVQRSTTLAAGSWEIISPVAGIDGTAGTAGFTDLSPPPNGAFYRVVLRP